MTTDVSLPRPLSLSRALSRASFALFDRWDRSDRMQEYRRLLLSERWAPEVHTAATLARLNQVLEYAFRHIPYYRNTYASVPVLDYLTEMQQFPILTKAAIREAGDSLMSQSCDPRTVLSAKTGGSTGTSLIVRFDHDCQQHRNAAALRSDTWAGWQPGDWTGALWGSPERPTSLKQKIRNTLRDRLEFLDTMRLDDTSMRDFLTLMRDKPIDAVFGHAHSLYILAQFKLTAGIEVPVPRAIVSTSMMLLAPERVIIEKAFGCPVTDRYGCEEVGLIAAECEQHHGYHVNLEHTYVEIVDEAGAPCKPGEVGRVLVTDLQNIAMPLIRYEVGDLSSWATSPCPCDRHGLPTLQRIVGRQADCLQRIDGSLVAGVSLVERTLLIIPGIAQLQLVQQDRNHLLAYLVAGPGLSLHTSAELTKALTQDLGAGIEVQVELVDRIPQEKNGKYRFAIRRF
jgi:phenylacetate-CoA ligase